MKCSKCRFENPPESTYCGKCATRLDSSREPWPAVTETMGTAREELTTGSTFAGRYQVIEELGQGGNQVEKYIDCLETLHRHGIANIGCCTRTGRGTTSRTWCWPARMISSSPGPWPTGGLSVQRLDLHPHFGRR